MIILQKAWKNSPIIYIKTTLCHDMALMLCIFAAENNINYGIL